MSNPAPTLNQINAFNATQGTTIDFNIIGGTEVIRSNKIYIYDLSDNSLICTHLYVSTESIHELPANTDSSIVYESGKSSADFVNGAQYYAQIQTFTDTAGTQGGSGLSIAKLFWCLPTPTLTLSTIPTTISTTSYNVSATYTPNTSGSATNEIQEFQFNLYSAIGALLQTSGVVLYGEGVDLSYNFSGLEVDSTYYVTLDVTTTQGMNVSAQSNTFTVSIDTPTMGSASVVNNGCDGYISVTSNLSSEYEHEESAEAGEIMSFTTDSVNDITELDVDFSPVQDGTPWMSAQDTTPYMFRAVPTQTEDFGHESDIIVGGTVAWNQLAPLSVSGWAYPTTSIDISLSGTEYTLTSKINTGTSKWAIINNLPLGHKLLAIAKVKSDGTAGSSFGFFASSGTAINRATISSSDTSYVNIAIIAMVTNASDVFAMRLANATVADAKAYFKDVMLIDLTQAFGSIIADYIYSLETATTGAGVAWFRKLFPNPYYAYNAGELISVSELESHDMVGFNVFDIDAVNISDSFSVSNGTLTNVKVDSRTFFQLSIQLYKDGQATLLSVASYVTTGKHSILFNTGDCIGGSIRIKHNGSTRDLDIVTAFSTDVLIPNTNYCLSFNLISNNPTIVGGLVISDICINISNESLNGTYEPYVKHSYPLDSDLTLRGIPKLDASNNLYYDGDIYHADGSVDRRYREVDLSSFSWVTRYTGSTNKTLSVDMTGYAYKTVNGVPNMMGAPYSRIESVGGVAVLNDPDSKSVGIYSYTQSMSGTAAYSTIYIVLPKNDSPSGKLVYELATPTTETADPYTNPQIVDPHGTEEYVGSPIPVGHETTYQRICPISGWDSVEVDVVGKNLFNKSNYGVLNAYISGGAFIGGAAFKTIYIPCKPNIEYTISSGTYTRPNALGYTTELPSVGGVVTITTNVKTITTGADAKYLVAYVYNANVDQHTLQDVINVLQIELGSTATTYTPYNGQTYTSTFPKYKQQVAQDKTPYITKDIGDTYADTLTENLVGGTIAWNQSVPDTTTTHTVSGSIASMDDAVAGNFESVVCDINPVQDLHGYDKPWVGGAGVNLLDVDSRVSQTTAGVTYTSDKDFITLNGTKSGGSYATMNGLTITLGAGTYYAKAFVISGSTTSSVGLYAYINGSDSSSLLSGERTITLTEETTFGFRFGLWTDGGTFTNYKVGIVVSKTSGITEWTPWQNLCPITGWTGCEVSVVGANLWDEQWESGGIRSTDGTNTTDANRVRSKNFIPVKAGETYYIKAPSSVTLYLYYNEQNFWSNVPVGMNQTYTIPSGITLAKFVMGSSSAPVTSITTGAFSFNYPSTDTTYHAYNGTTYPVSWQTEAGTVYGGTVDVVTGVLTVTDATQTFDDNTGTWEWYENYKQAHVSNALAQNPAYYDASTATYLCDRLKPIPNMARSQNVGNYIALVSNGSGIAVSTPCQTLSEFTTWVASNPIQFTYKLAQAQTYQLDPVQVACLLGQNNVWCDTGNTTVTYPTNHSYQSLSTTHKYYKRINGVESISVGSDVVADVGTDNIIDLTQMFGTTIADYIYNREQSSSSGMGVKFFKSLFPNDDYDYNSGELISVNASAHVIKDANGNVLHTYPLDSDLVLRGIPKLDANNKLYYDGDVYEADGSVTRKYGIVDLGTLTWYWSDTYKLFYAYISDQRISLASVVPNAICSQYPTLNFNTLGSDFTIPKGFTMYKQSESASGYVDIRDTSKEGMTTAQFKQSMSGVYVVYELATQTTEQADPFEENQAIVSNGVEEYTVTEQGDVEMPVGHDSTYYTTEVYGGTIDMAKGVLTITKKLTTITSFSGTFGQRTNGYCVYVTLSDRQESTDSISNMFVRSGLSVDLMPLGTYQGGSGANRTWSFILPSTITSLEEANAWLASLSTPLVVIENLATPIEISLTPQQMQTLSGQNNIWSNTNGGMYLVYQLPITSLLVKRRDVADVSGKWLTLYSTPITQASDMDFTFIDFLNQYGKTYQYALVPVLAQDQSGVVVQIEGGYTVSDNVDSIFDGVYIADQTNVERVKAGVGYGNIDMNQGVGSITPIGSKYPIVITNSQNQYHNGSVRGTIVPNDFYSNGNLSRIDMVNKRDELEQFLTNKRAKIIKDWNGKMWLVMIMSNVACSFDDNYGMGMVSFSADWLEVGDPTNQQDLYNAGLINVGGV